MRIRNPLESKSIQRPAQIEMIMHTSQGHFYDLINPENGKSIGTFRSRDLHPGLSLLGIHDMVNIGVEYSTAFRGKTEVPFTKRIVSMVEATG